MIDFAKLQRDAINDNLAARLMLFIVQGGVERHLYARRKLKEGWDD